MNGPFLIPIVYADSEQEYKARFERWGYTHRISVLIGEATVFFEPDEEGGYRAIRMDNASATVAVGLLQAISEKLAELN